VSGLQGREGMTARSVQVTLIVAGLLWLTAQPAAARDLGIPSLFTWGLPNFPPFLVQAPVQPLSNHIKVENHGSATIALSLIDKAGAPCGALLRLAPNTISDAALCPAGSSIRMHNGRDYTLFPTNAGHVYGVYWAEDRWTIRDITQERLER